MHNALQAPQTCTGSTGIPSSISKLHGPLFLSDTPLVWPFRGQTGVSPACSGVRPAVAAPGAELPLQRHAKLNTPLMGNMAITEKRRTGTALSAEGKNHRCYIKAVLQP